MADSAGVLLSAVWCESNTLGEVELPSLFEGQVCLLGVWDLHTILQELDADVRGVEATHVTDQGVVLPMFPWVTAVHLHLGGSYRGRREWHSQAGARTHICSITEVDYLILTIKTK